MDKFKDQGERIRKMREANTDLKANAMAEVLEIGEVRYGHYERGRSEMPTDILKKFCITAKTTPDYIRFGSQQISPSPVNISTVHVKGQVKAGTWEECRQWEQEEWGTVPFDLSENEKNAYGLRVLGDSMDDFYPPGSIAIVIPLHDFIGSLEGEHVIVQRCRGGDLYEMTIKELVINGDKAELWPRSKNPHHKEPVNLFWPYDKLQHHGIETVEIKGVVIGSINRRKRL